MKVRINILNSRKAALLGGAMLVAMFWRRGLVSLLIRGCGSCVSWDGYLKQAQYLYPKARQRLRQEFDRPVLAHADDDQQQCQDGRIRQGAAQRVPQ